MQQQQPISRRILIVKQHDVQLVGAARSLSWYCHVMARKPSLGMCRVETLP